MLGKSLIFGRETLFSQKFLAKENPHFGAPDKDQGRANHEVQTVN